MIDINELRRLAQAAMTGPDGVSLNWVKLLQDFQKEASPAAVSELLDRLEEAESDAIGQALLNGVGASHEAALMAQLEQAENERDWNAERLEDAIEECAALQAKIEAMEQQEPVGWQRLYKDGSGSEDFTDLPDVFEHQRPLYALPGAQGEKK